MNTIKSNQFLTNFFPIAKAIAKTFGKDCEVVLHDASNLDHSIIFIENGHVTGRQVGGPITDLGLYILKSDKFKDKDFVANYQTESKWGKKLKSTTIFIRNDKKKMIGFLCINYDIDRFLDIEEALRSFSKINKNLNEDFLDSNEKDELFTDDMNDLLEKLFKKAKDKFGKPLARYEKEDKLEIVRYLQKKGVFIVKGSIDKIAKKLNISRYTVYNYLKEIKYSNDDKVVK